MTERILYLMANPFCSEEKYCRMFEVSRRAYYRDKAYIAERLYMYKVEEKKRK